MHLAKVSLRGVECCFYFVLPCLLFSAHFYNISRESLISSLQKLVISTKYLALYSKTCLKWPFKNRKKQRTYLNEGQKYCRMLSWSILQYF